MASPWASRDRLVDGRVVPPARTGRRATPVRPARWAAWSASATAAAASRTSSRSARCTGARRGSRCAGRRPGSPGGAGPARAGRGWSSGPWRRAARQGRRQRPGGVVTGRAVGDHLGHHRVVVGRHDRARPARRCRSARPADGADLERRGTSPSTAGSRRPGPRRVSRASMAWPRSGASSTSSGSGAPLGDGQLQLDEVEPGDELGDRVLDLQPGVHLEEPEARRPGRAGTRRCPAPT